eukprot:gene1280-biopygen16773
MDRVASVLIAVDRDPPALSPTQRRPWRRAAPPPPPPCSAAGVPPCSDAGVPPLQRCTSVHPALQKRAWRATLLQGWTISPEIGARRCPAPKKT